jgi:hypothetical protein
MGFLSEVPGELPLAHTPVPGIQNLEDPLKSKAHEAFAYLLSVIWEVIIGIACISPFSTPFIKDLPLHGSIDNHYTLENEKVDFAASILQVDTQ